MQLDDERFKMELYIAVRAGIRAGKSPEKVKREVESFLQFYIPVLGHPQVHNIWRVIAQVIDEEHHLLVATLPHVVLPKQNSAPRIDTFKIEETSDTHSNTQKPKTSPPRLGEYVLHCLLSKNDRENIIGDLEEEFREKHTKFGNFKAKLWYWIQVICSILPLIRRTAQWGAIVWVIKMLGNLIRRLVS